MNNTKEQINGIQKEIPAYKPTDTERDYLNHILKRKYEMDTYMEETLKSWEKNAGSRNK